MLALAAALALSACDRPANPSAQAVAPQAAAGEFKPVTVQHQLGTTVVERPPQRVAALDMNEADFLRPARRAYCRHAQGLRAPLPGPVQG